MLSLRHLAVLEIDARQTFESRQIEVFKNIRHEISEIFRKQNYILKNAMNAYDDLRREYYRRLMKKDQESLVSTACSNLIINYNRMIDARNVCAATKTWTKNFIMLDEYIMKNLACPSLTSQYEELDKMLVGISHSKQDIELPEEIMPIDSELKNIIREYEELCNEIYKSMHANDEKCNLEGFSEKLQKAVKEENEARSNYIKVSKVLDHIDEILYLNGEKKPDEELLELFTLFQNLPF
jgi:hypothetical protein